MHFQNNRKQISQRLGNREKKNQDFSTKLEHQSPNKLTTKQYKPKKKKKMHLEVNPEVPAHGLRRCKNQPQASRSVN